LAYTTGLGYRPTCDISPGHFQTSSSDITNYVTVDFVMAMASSSFRRRGTSSMEQSSPTARLLAPSENISRPICFHCHSGVQNNTLLTL